MSKMYLLDTNALSENTKRTPNQGFIKWLEQIDQMLLYTSCLAIGEAQKGALLMKDPVQRKRIETHNKALVAAFADQILIIDEQTAAIWARITARTQSRGLTGPQIDGLIAAQAIQHEATLVTRNIRDFKHFEELEMLCPWS